MTTLWTIFRQYPQNLNVRTNAEIHQVATSTLSTLKVTLTMELVFF